MLRPSDRAPGLLVGEDVKLPAGIEIGGNVIVHAGTVLREGVRLGDWCTVGQAPLLGPRSSASREPPGPAILEEGVSVGAGSVVVTSVPANATIVGVPGHIVAYRDDANATIQRLPDPEWERLNELDRKIEDLHELVHHLETHSNGVHAEDHKIPSDA